LSTLSDTDGGSNARRTRTNPHLLTTSLLRPAGCLNLQRFLASGCSPHRQQRRVAEGSPPGEPIGHALVAPAEPLGRKRNISRHLAGLATRRGEKCGLIPDRSVPLGLSWRPENGKTGYRQ